MVNSSNVLFSDYSCYKHRNARKEYIVAKYVDRRYVVRREDGDPCRAYGAVRGHDLTSLLQLYAEGEDLAKPLKLPDGQVQGCLRTGATPGIVFRSFCGATAGPESLTSLKHLL